MKTIAARQLEILRVLWGRGQATAREITDDLSPTALSTVQTLLRELEGKGLVGHTVDDRTFIFHPLIAEDTVRESVTRDLLERIFQGSAFGLVAHLVKQERLSPEDVTRLRALLDESEKENTP